MDKTTHEITPGYRKDLCVMKNLNTEDYEINETQKPDNKWGNFLIDDAEEMKKMNDNNLDIPSRYYDEIYQYMAHLWSHNPETRKHYVKHISKTINEKENKQLANNDIKRKDIIPQMAREALYQEAHKRISYIISFPSDDQNQSLTTSDNPVVIISDIPQSGKRETIEWSYFLEYNRNDGEILNIQQSKTIFSENSIIYFPIRNDFAIILFKRQDLYNMVQKRKKTPLDNIDLTLRLNKMTYINSIKQIYAKHDVKLNHTKQTIENNPVEILSKEKLI